jgi:hypothetical protein
VSDSKTISFTINGDTYDELELLCPGKKWGENRKREYYRHIFELGLQSAEMLNKRNRWMSQKIKMLEGFVPPDLKVRLPELESILLRSFLYTESAGIQQHGAKKNDRPEGSNNGGASTH